MLEGISSNTRNERVQRQIQRESFLSKKDISSSGMFIDDRRPVQKITANLIQRLAYAPNQTDIDYYKRNFVFRPERNSEKTETVTVGAKMEALLAPNDIVKGSETVGGDQQQTLITSMRKRYPSARILRGHLLNHDLGGYAVPQNLYPITQAANNQHKMYMEQAVESALWEASKISGRSVYYQVVADGQFNDAYEKDNHQDKFVCLAKNIDFGPNGSVSENGILQTTIYSAPYKKGEKALPVEGGRKVPRKAYHLLSGWSHKKGSIKGSSKVRMGDEDFATKSHSHTHDMIPMNQPYNFDAIIQQSPEWNFLCQQLPPGAFQARLGQYLHDKSIIAFADSGFTAISNDEEVYFVLSLIPDWNQLKENNPALIVNFLMEIQNEIPPDDGGFANWFVGFSNNYPDAATAILKRTKFNFEWADTIKDLKLGKSLNELLMERIITNSPSRLLDFMEASPKQVEPYLDKIFDQVLQSVDEEVQYLLWIKLFQKFPTQAFQAMTNKDDLKISFCHILQADVRDNVPQSLYSVVDEADFNQKVGAVDFAYIERGYPDEVDFYEKLVRHFTEEVTQPVKSQGLPLWVQDANGRYEMVKQQLDLLLSLMQSLTNNPLCAEWGDDIQELFESAELLAPDVFFSESSSWEDYLDWDTEWGNFEEDWNSVADGIIYQGMNEGNPEQLHELLYNCLSSGNSCMTGFVLDNIGEISHLRSNLIFSQDSQWRNKLFSISNELTLTMLTNVVRNAMRQMFPVPVVEEIDDSYVSTLLQESPSITFEDLLNLVQQHCRSLLSSVNESII